MVHTILSVNTPDMTRFGCHEGLIADVVEETCVVKIPPTRKLVSLHLASILHNLPIITTNPVDDCNDLLVLFQISIIAFNAPTKGGRYLSHDMQFCVHDFTTLHAILETSKHTSESLHE